MAASLHRAAAYTERLTLSYKDMDTEDLDWLDWRAKDPSELHLSLGILHSYCSQSRKTIPANQNLVGKPSKPKRCTSAVYHRQLLLAIGRSGLSSHSHSRSATGACRRPQNT